jgi:hypothetical protein
MTVILFVDREKEVVHLMSQVVSADGRTKGKIQIALQPGEDYHGYTYDMLVRLGPGKHELTFPPPKAEPARARA